MSSTLHGRWWCQKEGSMFGEINAHVVDVEGKLLFLLLGRSTQQRPKIMRVKSEYGWIGWGVVVVSFSLVIKQTDDKHTHNKNKNKTTMSFSPPRRYFFLSLSALLLIMTTWKLDRHWLSCNERHDDDRLNKKPDERPRMVVLCTRPRMLPWYVIWNWDIASVCMLGCTIAVVLKLQRSTTTLPIKSTEIAKLLLWITKKQRRPQKQQ